MNRRISVVCLIALFGVCLLGAMTPVKHAGPDRRGRKPSDSRVYLLHADKLYFDDQIHSEGKIVMRITASL